MGSFLGNVHVQAADGVDAARAAVVAAVAADGWVPTDGPADRTVAFVQGDRWLHVFDDGSEGGDATVLDGLAKTLSKALGTAAFSVIVHDSDFLVMRLYETGKDHGRWASDEQAGMGRKKPDRDAWARQAVPDADSALWRGVFDSDPVFAEERLAPLSTLIGADVQLLNCTLRELPADTGVRLALRDGRRRAPTASGPPVLTVRMQPPPVRAAVGGAVHLGLSVANEGGPSRGLRVRVEDAEGLVHLDTLRLFAGTPQGGAEGRPFTVEHVDPDLVLAPDEPLDPRDLSGGRMRAAMDRMFQSQVSVGLSGTGLAVGEGTLRVHVEPLDPDGRGVVLATPVQVQSTADRPLRAPADVHPHMLEALRGDRWLCALVAGPDVPALLALVDAVAAHLPTDGPLHHAIFPAPKPGGGLLALLQGATSRPKQGGGKARGFFAGKRWQKLRDAALAGDQIDVSWGERDGESAGTAGLLLGRGIIPSPTARPVLALGLRDASPDAADALRDAIDGLAGQGLVQAQLARWGARCSNELSPYEAACQVHGQCTLDEAWLARWLRGVGVGSLWLGPALRERVEEEALGEVAALTAVGPALRVDIANLRPVEEALAAVLPSHADWVEGQRARYGR